ncbi:MAG: hypothetical protein JW751_01480 [Polyangiaceae bacterium]|nr:hypothetical protein [Polyangiaceae bacterium]
MPRNPGVEPRAGWIATIVVAAIAGCGTPVAADLDEREANRAVVVLEESGVVASKEPDPNREARWQISVPRHEATLAVAALEAHGLPHPATPGLLEALPGGGLVPSRTAEHARFIAGVSGELERSLLGVDGVLSARIHLAVPRRDEVSFDPRPSEPSASVLLQHRGRRPPVPVADVQRLVAGAVPGLDPARVSVVAAPVADPPPNTGPGLVRWGPIAVTRPSLIPLRWVVGGAIALQLALLAAAIGAWTRLRRTQRAMDGARVAAETDR